MAISALRPLDAAIAKSRNEFQTYVWPEIVRFFPAGRLIDVEGQQDPAARQLDQLGIDYLYRPTDGEPYGVSQRTGHGPWRTVTMNEQTMNRLTSMWGRSGAFLPAIHVQSYLDGNADGSMSFLSATLIRVGVFVRYIEHHPGECHVNTQRGTTFRSWTFDELDAADVSIVTVPARQLIAPFGP